MSERLYLFLPLVKHQCVKLEHVAPPHVCSDLIIAGMFRCSQRDTSQQTTTNVTLENCFWPEEEKKTPSICEMLANETCDLFIPHLKVFLSDTSLPAATFRRHRSAEVLQTVFSSQSVCRSEWTSERLPELLDEWENLIYFSLGVLFFVFFSISKLYLFIFWCQRCSISIFKL